MSETEPRRRWFRRAVVPPVQSERPPSPPASSAPFSALDTVPRGMQIAGAWSWRILVVVGVLVVLGFLIIQLRLLIIPLMVAVVLSALLVPFKNFLVRHRWPKWLAIATAELGTLVVVAALIFLVVTQVTSGFADLREQTMNSYNDLKSFLAQSPLQVSEDDFNGYVAQIWQSVQDDSSALLSGAAALGSSVGHVLTGVLLTLFSTLFILIDGERIWGLSLIHI